MKSKSWILILLLLTLSIYITRHMTVNYMYQKTFEDSPLYDHGTWISNDLKSLYSFFRFKYD